MAFRKVPHMQVEGPDTAARLSRTGRTVLWLVLLCVLVGGGLLAFAGIRDREAAAEHLRAASAEQAVPTVAAAPPTALSNIVELLLPGRLEPYTRADIYARVSGYVSSWKYDIGAAVKAGDVLGEIDAPDLDQQLFQARSDLTNAQVAEQLSKLTNERFQKVTPGLGVTRQTIDEKAADVSAKQAQVKSAQANVDRLIALAKYKQLVAPFDGIVTARSTDLGALITAGSSAGTPLFVVSSSSRLRLFINVPQSYAPLVSVGTLAHVIVLERPGHLYDGKIEAVSGAIDSGTGTSRLQIIVDNPKGELLPGAYVNVSLKLTNPNTVLTIPASALIVDKNGSSVAVVSAAGTVSLKRVTVSRDLGKSIEIATGLDPNDLVIESPPDGILDNDQVRVKSPQALSGPSSGPVPARPDKG